MEIEEVGNFEAQALPLLSLNHVSLLCRSVWESMRFYEEVLGFVPIKRPSSFKFTGAWLACLLNYHPLSFFIALYLATQNSENTNVTMLVVTYNSFLILFFLQVL